MFLLTLLNYLLIVIASILTIPIIVFAVECFMAILPQKKKKYANLFPRPKTAILIPAHNEAKQIEFVVEEAKLQLQDGDRLIVIADNCQDETAEIARSAGATVIERVNEVERGKGYALDCGLRYLENTDIPDIVVFLDADCIAAYEAIAHITCLAYETGRPVQAKYLMEQENNPSLKDRVSTFALKVKNRIRFMGLNRLGGHCLLTGSGMAFPWSVISKASLVGSINADDMKLTVDLTLKNLVPTYCDEAFVVGRLMEAEDAQSQRTRWEHGHLQMISVEVPRLIKAFFRQPNFALLLLALDISIPPVSLLIMIWAVAFFLTVLAKVLLGTSLIPTTILGLAGFVLFSAIFTVWSKFGTKDLPLKDLIAVPFYIVSKLPIYLKFLVNPQAGWSSTERDL